MSVLYVVCASLFFCDHYCYEFAGVYLCVILECVSNYTELEEKKTNFLIPRKFKMGSLEDSLKHLEVSLAQKQHVNYVIYGVVSLK